MSKTPFPGGDRTGAWPPKKESASSQKLPDPDLNPALNPILERNLGRWAAVYFTNPPEKREQAVLELLRELENAASGPGAVKATGSADEAETASRPVGQNPAAGAASGVVVKSGTEPSAVRQKPVVKVQVAPELLRWRSYGVPVLAVLVAGLTYLGWRSYRSADSAPGTAHSVSVIKAGATSPPTVAPKPDSGAGRSSTAASKTSPHRNGIESTPAFEPLVPARLSDRLPTAPARPAIGASPSKEEGTQELRLGQNYLTGKSGNRDSREAAKWLWKAVGKQNTPAVLLLADLYLRGDGVARNCDQARLLLAAAAKRGVAAASARLRELDSDGCR